MNELSWLIYLADVAGGAKGLSTGLAIACGVGVVMFTFVGIIAADKENFERKYRNGPAHEPEKEEMSRRVKTKSFGAIRPLIITCIVASIASVFIPTQSTIYAIAASEMGERVIQSETGDKAIQALNAWLDRQIAGKPDA